MTKCKHLLVFGLLALGSGQAALDPALNRPSHCMWMAKTPITDFTNLPTCLDQCYAFCQSYPREYLCYGQTVHVDTETERYLASTTPYVYCYCHRSVITRKPGFICGPDSEPCEMAANDPTTWDLANPPTANDLPDEVWVDGINTFISGYQGHDVLSAQTKTTFDTDVNCQNDLIGKLHYIFRDNVAF